MVNKVLNLLVFIFLIVGCTKDRINLNDNVTIFGYESSDLARRELGAYARLFDITNGSVQIQTTAYNTLDRGFGTIFGRFQESTTSPRIDGGVFSFGDLRLVYSESHKKYIPEDGDLDPSESYDRISKYFGREIDFRVENIDNEIDGSFYVPEEIRVEIDGLTTNSLTNAFSIKLNDTRIVWNGDSQNENGVVLHLVFDGSSLTNGSIPDSASGFERAIKFEDNGEGVIPKEFFEGIPEDGIFTIYFLRGAVDIIENTESNQNFKFYALTKDKYNFLLKI